MPFNLVGLEALRRLLATSPTMHGTATPDGGSGRATAGRSASTRSQADGHGLVMLMGKGGVGKTTLAAAIAVELAGAGMRCISRPPTRRRIWPKRWTARCTNLTVSRIDPHAETERYRQHVLETKGAKLDAQGRALLEEDLRSPCTEEIAVFQAFSRIIREADKNFVVMDTAPTGHTLLLLDATGAYHREVVRQLGATGRTSPRR